MNENSGSEEDIDRYKITKSGHKSVSLKIKSQLRCVIWSPYVLFLSSYVLSKKIVV